MRCDHWLKGQRCTQKAEYRLHAPDGQRNPGGGSCAEHAAACIIEYAEKFGEYWSGQPIDEFGETAPGEVLRAVGDPESQEVAP